MCLDANHLYCWAKSQYLPGNKFKRLNQKEIDKFDIDLISENSLDGYILEVNLEYHHEFAYSHELHNDYPLAPERPEIGHNMLPKYCNNIGSVNKLNPYLGSKRKYVLC